MLAALAVIGKNNDPLFLRIYQEGFCIDGLNIDPDADDYSQLLRYHYLFYCSLDLVEERHRKPGAGMNNSKTQVSMYLGYLCSIEEFNVYGYVNNTHTKFIVAVKQREDSNTTQPELPSFCKSIHRLYVNQMQNPFALLDKPIRSEKFEAKVDKIVSQFNGRLSSGHK